MTRHRFQRIANSLKVPKGVTTSGKFLNFQSPPQEWYIEVSSEVLGREELYEFLESAGINKEDFLDMGEEDTGLLVMPGGPIDDPDLDIMLTSYSNILAIMGGVMAKLRKTTIPPFIKINFFIG